MGNHPAYRHPSIKRRESVVDQMKQSISGRIGFPPWEGLVEVEQDKEILEVQLFSIK